MELFYLEKFSMETSCTMEIVSLGVLMQQSTTRDE